VIGSVTPTTWYIPTSPFGPTSAGIGEFNLSLALNSPNTTDYIFLSQLYFLFIDPTQSFPIPWDNSTAECIVTGDSSGCSSYVFPGSIQAISNGTYWPDSTAVLFTRDSPALRFEFWDLNYPDGNWTSDDCVVFGTGTNRVGLCIANSVVYKNALTAGLTSTFS
jgi:hypothetical protein